MAPTHKPQHLLAWLTQPIVREVITTLADGEIDVASLAKRLDLDNSTVSRTLSRLRAEELVTYRRKWRQHIYRLTERVRLKAAESSEQIEITTIAGERISLSSVKTRLAERPSHLSIVSNDK